MNNKIQKRPQGKASKSKKYDVFISYRRLSSTDFDHRHSTSLARSVAQAFESKGFKVFFDCWQGTQACLEELRRSKYFIILVTKYSFEKGGGDGYKQEIEEIIKSQAIHKDHIFLFNVDQSYESVHKLKEDFQEFVGGNLDAEVIPFSTKSDFTTTINHLIEPEHGSKIAIKKFPRFGYDFCKVALPICALLALLALSFGIRQQKHCDDTKNQLETCNNQLKQYEDSCIIFAGGGTVQRYLNDKNNIDVNNYQDYPSKYIHLPSKDAWSLLWDDVNEEKNRTYCPIVLSTTKIDLTEVNIKTLESERRIVEYNIDSIPLMVQIFDDQNSSDPITRSSLIKMLQDTSKYEIWTTTERSGTYREYTEFLNKDKEFNLDILINKQKGGRKNFNPTSTGQSKSNRNKAQLFLANSCYYYTYDPEKRSDRMVVSDTSPQEKISVHLYVYTIAVTEGDSYKLLPQAEKFFKRIGCNTEREITYRDSMVVTLPPK